MEFQLMNLLPPNLLYAVCVTLFHSLWMGVVLAVLTSIVIVSTKNSKASTRYYLLNLCLLLFVAATGFVFYHSFSTASAAVSAVYGGASQASGFVEGGGLSISIFSSRSSGFIGSIDSLMSLWTSYSVQIFMVWFLIICIKGIQLMVGVHQVYYLKNTKVFDSGTFWESKVAELSAAIGVNKGVRLLQSGVAIVPMTIGHLKPVILLPLGLLNGLSAAEVEAILCHELAHIKRNDYLVNFIQSLIEVVFFFNPAVLWVSKLIKEEREHCCDDLALIYSGSKKEYINALISCQEFQSAPEFAMALTGRKNQLLERVKRMAFNRSTSLNNMEKMILTTALICTLLFSAAFRSNEKTVKQVAGEMKEHVEIAVQDSIKKATVKKKVPAKVTRTVKSTKTLSETEVDALSSTEPEVARGLTSTRSTKLASLGGTGTLRNYTGSNVSSNVAYLSHEASAKHAARYADAVSKYTKALEKYTEDIKAYQKRLGDGDFEVLPTLPTLPTAPTAPTAPEPLTLPYAAMTRTNSGITGSRSFYSANMPNLSKSSAKSTVSPASKAAEINTDEINAELIKDGIIKNTGNLSYKIDKDELIVNDVKQPSEVHQKYKNKYLKRESTKLMYNYRIN